MEKDREGHDCIAAQRFSLCSFYSIQVRIILTVYGKREERHKITQTFSKSGPQPVREELVW